jgi:hypothetical protein
VARLTFRAYIARAGDLAGLTFGTVVEGTTVGSGLPENHVGTNLLGNGSAVFTHCLTDLLERLTVDQTSFDLRPVFIIQMTIFSHHGLLFWSEQQVVDLRSLLYTFSEELTSSHYSEELTSSFKICCWNLIFQLTNHSGSEIFDEQNLISSVNNRIIVFQQGLFIRLQGLTFLLIAPVIFNVLVWEERSGFWSGMGISLLLCQQFR